MQILIAERLKPFCHLPGTSMILPGVGYQVQIFPCFLRIFHLNKSSPQLIAELYLDFTGPVEQFTMCNDLEKGKITVWGRTAYGWMRYHLISSKKEGFRLLFEKVPKEGVTIHHDQKQYHLQDKNWCDFLLNHSHFEPYQVPSLDRLSLGSHKAQDWELIKRRLDITEIFPLWHRLGQMVPQMAQPSLSEGSLILLDQCQKDLMDNKITDKEKSWLNVIRAGFNSLLTPRLQDDDFQGLLPFKSIISSEISPLLLLSEGSKLIRQLFFQQDKNRLYILPHLIPTLHCGRLINVPLEGGGRISLEWTKKTIRRIILTVEQDQELTLNFRPNVKNYRLRKHLNNKGERLNCNSPMFFKKQTLYFFDNFK